MVKRDYEWQSPVDCPNCKTPLLIRKVFWFTPYDYWYLFQCKSCSEERSGKLVAENEYVPFWKQLEKPVLKQVPFKMAKRVTEEK
jgi:hypothetical protein